MERRLAILVSDSNGFNACAIKELLHERLIRVRR
jgi:hypothetical protein